MMNTSLEISELNRFSSSITFLDNLCLLLSENNVKKSQYIRSDLIHKQFLEEIKNLPPYISVELGETLRDLKCIITDEQSIRKYEIYLKYKDAHKLVVTAVNLPHSAIQDREYSSIEEVANTYKNYVANLSNYLYELECIDNLCTVMEPIQPTFKDEFRRVALDERTWLHIEVTPDGSATNIHLVGHSEHWQDNLQAGLLNWDHDKNIVDNIMSIFDLPNTSIAVKHLSVEVEPNDSKAEITCGICFCTELPDMPGIPQPLCQNYNCGVYFHKYCLYQWLVACEGGCPPAFGVANGSCPTCLQPIACNEQDS